MRNSKAHFVVQGVLKVMTTTRWILMTLIKAGENIFEYNSDGLLDIVKVN